MIVANKEAYKLSEETGCPISECKSALLFCKDYCVAFYYLKLTGEAVVRYKKDSDKIVKWNKEDYLKKAERLSKNGIDYFHE